VCFSSSGTRPLRASLLLDLFSSENYVKTKDIVSSDSRFARRLARLRAQLRCKFCASSPTFIHLASYISAKDIKSSQNPANMTTWIRHTLKPKQLMKKPAPPSQPQINQQEPSMKTLAIHRPFANWNIPDIRKEQSLLDPLIKSSFPFLFRVIMLTFLFWKYLDMCNRARRCIREIHSCKGKECIIWFWGTK